MKKLLRRLKSILFCLVKNVKWQDGQKNPMSHNSVEQNQGDIITCHRMITGEYNGPLSKEQQGLRVSRCWVYNSWLLEELGFTSTTWKVK